MLATLAVGACLPASIVHAGLIYEWVNYPVLQNGYSIVGAITTDGSLGFLSNSAFEAWSNAIIGPNGPVGPAATWTSADGFLPDSTTSGFQNFDGSFYADPTGLYIVGPDPWTLMGWVWYDGGFLGGGGEYWAVPCPWNGPELIDPVYPDHPDPTFLVATPVPEPGAGGLLLFAGLMGLIARLDAGGAGKWRKERGNTLPPACRVPVTAASGCIPARTSSERS